MQTKKQSLAEACINTAVGFLISFASTFLIFPLVGIASSAGKNIIITLFFTAISILRGYVIRRWFNKSVAKQKPVSPDDDQVFWMHCFECENDMPVIDDKEIVYCSNCGLKH
ncbi:hypothetical protein FORMB_25450 [Formosa sp. Hel1_33_131]|uniref:DUF7220 family protein n=1 Tax=Formosa sp. Hel1_33_131 TaxID=1336794 RepID=UPI00084E36DF|nr:hypothetical protein [Formosa sp. Hel1_33_131]AOR29562.1 hypothetical protein FORMB_25450 [Formosa sp. Hel1_33_131]